MTSNNGKMLSVLLMMAAMAAYPAGTQAQRTLAQTGDQGAAPGTVPPPTTFPEDGDEPLPNDSGARGVTPPPNPFVNSAPPVGNKAQAFDDGGEDAGYEEEDEISDEILRQRMEERIRAKAAQGGLNSTFGGSSTSTNSRPSSPASSSGSITVSAGGQPGGNASGRGPGCLRLDPDTGYGPDVVTNFDFPDADIVEIAKTLGKLTCLNFILDKDVKGRISIVSNSPITVGDAWKAFLTALDVNQFSIIPSGKYLRIARQRDAKDKQLKIYPGAFAPETDAMITRVIPLKYINAEEVRRVFMNITAPSTRMLAYEQTNTLIITDTGANIKKLVDLIALLDVEGFDENLQVVQIKNASAEEIAKLIDQLLPGNQGGGAPAGAPGVPRFGSRAGAARKTREGGVISHIIADSRTNSLIVSANARGFQQVKELVKKLDTKVALNQGGSRIHVVYLQHADAEQVSQTLNSLTAGAAPTKAAPGAPQNAVLFEGSVKVAADKPTNSLVVTASPTDFMLVKRVLKKLDVPRDQVYVEAIIMELVMDKNFSLSTSVINPSNGIGFIPGPDLAQSLMNPLGLQGLALGFRTGNAVSYTDPQTNRTIELRSITGLIKALQTNASANVLATPQILTLDNQEANIEISESVPVATVTAVQGAGTAQSFTQQKAALSLTIKPQINKISDFVKLDIKQKQEDFKATASEIPGAPPGTTGRSSQTTVIVQDQDTIALGGLIRERVNEQATKVPILGDIPLLGWLFRAKSTSTSKMNLLVFITPRIVKQYQVVRKILDKKIQERDEFLERANGGVDPYKEQKLKMIKELPPVSELKNGYKIENTDLNDEEDDASESSETTLNSTIPPSLKDVPPQPATGTQAQLNSNEAPVTPTPPAKQ